ncbi:MAG TPA: hypothetical protein VF886_04190 [Roseiarcus sp.]
MSDTAIAAAPIVAAAQPYITAIVTSVVGLGVAGGASLLKRWTGIALQQSFIAEIEGAAETEAAKAVAAAADNLAKTQINVGSSIVKTAVQSIMASQTLKTAITETGMTPHRLASIVTGEIGKLQAQMTATAPAAPPGKTLS